jgi:hypothetical protein
VPGLCPFDYGDCFFWNFRALWYSAWVSVRRPWKRAVEIREFIVSAWPLTKGVLSWSICVRSLYIAPIMDACDRRILSMILVPSTSPVIFDRDVQSSLPSGNSSFEFSQQLAFYLFPFSFVNSIPCHGVWMTLIAFSKNDQTGSFWAYRHCCLQIDSLLGCPIPNSMLWTRILVFSDITEEGLITLLLPPRQGSPIREKCLTKVIWGSVLYLPAETCNQWAVLKRHIEELGLRPRKSWSM